MEESTLYNLLSMGALRKWRKAEEEKEDYIEQHEKDLIEEMKTGLNEKSRDLLNSYSLAIVNRMDYLHYNLNIKILNLGIKIGMDLEKAFHEYDEE